MSTRTQFAPASDPCSRALIYEAAASANEGDCAHHGFHEITTQYDRERRVLRYVWTCESCGTQLTELYQREYAPRFDRFVAAPQGNAATAV
jgi:hypothetical protein